MKDLITIIVVTYKRGEELKCLLNSIKSQEDYLKYIYEIIIINNGDEYGYEWIYDLEDIQCDLKIKYIKSPLNLGVTKGRNLGIEKSASELLLFIDDDAEFLNEDALKNLFNYIKNEDQNIGAFAFKVLYFENREIQKNVFPHKLFKKYFDKKEFNTSHFIGAAHLLKKSVIDKAGKYSGDFFYGMEEYEMSYKIIEAGFKIRYTNQVVVLHKESAKGRMKSKLKNRMLWKNKTIISWMFLPNKYFFSTSVIWSLYYLIKNNFDFISFIKTWFDIIRSIKTENRSKLSNQSIEYLKNVEARLWY